MRIAVPGARKYAGLLGLGFSGLPGFPAPFSRRFGFGVSVFAGAPSVASAADLHRYFTSRWTEHLARLLLIDTFRLGFRMVSSLSSSSLGPGDCDALRALFVQLTVNSLRPRSLFGVWNRVP